MAETFFYVLSAIAVAFGVGVVSARSPMMSVLSLLGTFVCLAGVYLLAGYPFLAAAQLLVYAGAIMVLFLFVVMLLNMDREEAHPERPVQTLGPRRIALFGGAAAAIAMVSLFAIGWGEGSLPDAALLGQPLDDLESIAALLFSRYMLPFEAASMLLLATMIGVIVLAKRQSSGGAVLTSPSSYPYRTASESARGAQSAAAPLPAGGAPHTDSKEKEVTVP